MKQESVTRLLAEIGQKTVHKKLESLDLLDRFWIPRRRNRSGVCEECGRLFDDLVPVNGTE